MFSSKTEKDTHDLNDTHTSIELDISWCDNLAKEYSVGNPSIYLVVRLTVKERLGYYIRSFLITSGFKSMLQISKLKSKRLDLSNKCKTITYCLILYIITEMAVNEHARIRFK